MNTFLRTIILFLMLCGVFTHSDGISQEPLHSNIQRDSLLVAAREIMKAARYCALITVDENGQPHARAMDPFSPEDNMAIWLATNPTSRKVRHIRNNPRVALYYFNSEAPGYVSIYGNARIVDDPREKVKRWKVEWQQFYPDRKNNYTLIEVTPIKLEIVSTKHNITSKSDTWIPPAITFPSPSKSIPKK